MFSVDIFAGKVFAYAIFVIFVIWFLVIIRDGHGDDSCNDQCDKDRSPSGSKTAGKSGKDCGKMMLPHICKALPESPDESFRGVSASDFEKVCQSYRRELDHLKKTDWICFVKRCREFREIDRGMFLRYCWETADVEFPVEWMR